MGLMDFFSPDAGQARRKWLNEQAGGLWSYVPPEVRPWVALGAEVNPVVSMERAGQGAQRIADPNVRGWDKVQAVGDTASNMAGVVAPVVAASRGAVPAVQAAEDALMGFSSAAGVPDFLASEYGGFRAFHGSPHDFDRFDLSKIGTGEGAQAYGHGLYFAESEDVARAYRDQLTSRAATPLGPERALQRALFDANNNPDRAAATLQEAISSGAYEGQQLSWLTEALDRLQAGKLPGRMYEVEINASPEDFLDWDKPLSEQPARVRESLGPMFGPRADGLTGQDIYKKAAGFDPMVNVARKQGESADRMLPVVFPDASPEEIAQAIRAARATESGDRVAADMLAAKGIPGIRYLDAGSRGAGDGSRNYVVFDDKLIEIVRKYGIAGAAVMLGVSEADVAQAMQQGNE